MMAASQDDDLNAGTMVPFDLIRGSLNRRIKNMMNFNPKVFLKSKFPNCFRDHTYNISCTKKIEVLAKESKKR